MDVTVRADAILSFNEQGDVAANLGKALEARGYDGFVISPSPDGAHIEVQGSARVEQLQSQVADLLDAVVPDRAKQRSRALGRSLEITVAELSGPEAPTTDAVAAEGGSGLWNTVQGTCTAGFTVGYFGGEGITTAGHCAPYQSYSWIWDPDIARYSLWRVAQTTYQIDYSHGDVARHYPIPQWQLDQWYGQGVYSEADPVPYFFAWFTTNKRPVNSAFTPAVGSPVCYAGQKHPQRTCNHTVIQRNLTTYDPDEYQYHINHQTSASNPVALDMGGDSGMIYSYNYAVYGLHSRSNSSYTYMTPTGVVEGALAWDACTTSNSYC